MKTYRNIQKRPWDQDTRGIKTFFGVYLHLQNPRELKRIYIILRVSRNRMQHFFQRVENLWDLFLFDKTGNMKMRWEAGFFLFFFQSFLPLFTLSPLSPKLFVTCLPGRPPICCPFFIGQPQNTCKHVKTRPFFSTFTDFKNKLQ